MVQKFDVIGCLRNVSLRFNITSETYKDVQKRHVTIDIKIITCFAPFAQTDHVPLQEMHQQRVGVIDVI